MEENATSLSFALQNIDPVRGFDFKYLHISLNIPECFEWHDLPSIASVGLTRQQLLDLYYYMALTRELDIRIKTLTRQSRAFGKHLMSVGNEASAVGIAYAMQKQDWLGVAIRDLGAFLTRGAAPEKILATSCAKATSATAGWDAGLHMSDLEHNIVGIISHLGVVPAVATGLAFAEEYLRHSHDNNQTASDNLKSVTVACSGDAATSSGGIYEALNIAAVKKLPFVLVIENNQWGFGTPVKLQYATKIRSLLALGYDIDGYAVDGTNVLAVYGVMKRALEQARINNRVAVIETRSFRYEGHSINDNWEKYVPREEWEAWKKKDPLDAYPDVLLKNNIADTEDFVKIREQAKTRIDKAEETVLSSPHPDAKNIEQSVFMPSPAHKNTLFYPPAEGKKITYHAAIKEALDEILSGDAKAFLIGEDIGVSGGAFKITDGLLKKYDGLCWNDSWNIKEFFPERRVVDAPLAEKGFCGLALGATIRGLHPIVEFQYADFSVDADVMIKKWAATCAVRGLGPTHIVFRCPAGWAKSVGPFHGVNPESDYAGTPGLKIVAPATSFDAKGLLKAAILDGNPVLFLEYKAMYRIYPDNLPPELNTPIPENDYIVPIGKARILKQGNGLTLITYGSQTLNALMAVHEIEKEKNDTSLIEVIDLRSIVPWDKDCVATSVKKTGKALISCEAPKTGSFANTVAAWIAENLFNYLDGYVSVVAALDTPVPFAEEMEREHLPTSAKIKTAIEKLLAY